MRNFILPLLLLATTANAGTLVVVNKADNDISLIDADTGVTRARLAAGNGPHEVAVSPDGRWGLVTNYGWQPGNSLTLIDIANAQVVDTYFLDGQTRPHGIAWSGDKVWVTAENTGEAGALLAVDPADGSLLAALPTGQALSHMVALHPGGRWAYVANIDSNSVSVFDRVEGQRVAIVPTGLGPEGIAVTPDGSELWVASQDSSQITVFATDTLAERARILTHGRPMRIAFSPDGARALVPCGRSNEVAVFDVEQRREITRIRFDRDNPRWPYGQVPSPIGVLVSPDGERAYVALVASDLIAEIDLRDYSLTRLIQAGNQPDGLGWSPLDVAVQ